MKILFLFIQFIFVFDAFGSAAKAMNGKREGNISEHKTISKKSKIANSHRQVVKIDGEFVIKNKHKVNFMLSERDGKYYLTLSVAGGSCDYLVRRLKAPQQIRGYKGIIFSNKVPNCNFGILDKETNKLFNNFELVDLVYSVKKNGKIEGDITLSSLTETYKSKI